MPTLGVLTFDVSWNAGCVIPEDPDERAAWLDVHGPIRSQFLTSPTINFDSYKDAKKHGFLPDVNGDLLPLSGEFLEELAVIVEWKWKDSLKEWGDKEGLPALPVITKSVLEECQKRMIARQGVREDMRRRFLQEITIFDFFSPLGKPELLADIPVPDDFARGPSDRVSLDRYMRVMQQREELRNLLHRVLKHGGWTEENPLLAIPGMRNENLPRLGTGRKPPQALITEGTLDDSEE